MSGVISWPTQKPAVPKNSLISASRPRGLIQKFRFSIQPRAKTPRRYFVASWEADFIGAETNDSGRENGMFLAEYGS